MSTDLNTIQLNAAVTASLYRTSLIDSHAPETTGKTLQAAAITGDAWKFLGDNKKNILVAVNHPDIIHLPDDELNLLTTILAACKMSLGDVAIINTYNYPEHSYKNYLGYFNSTTVLLFGRDPVSFGLPVDFPHFQVQSFAKTTFLYSPPLAKYDQLAKSKLWVCLKLIFSI